MMEEFRKSIRGIIAILIAVVVFPLLWVGQGCGWLNLPGEVIGATITIETLITQFYFRKKVEGE